MNPSSAIDRSRELAGLLGQERNSLVEFILRLADFNKLGVALVFTSINGARRECR